LTAEEDDLERICDILDVLSGAVEAVKQGHNEYRDGEIDQVLSLTFPIARIAKPI
jgi:hypothetical protein